MTHERLALCFVTAALTGCASPTLPTTAPLAGQIVGTWRATLTSDAKSFSDYVFTGGGTLDTLRTVVDGKTVATMQGAGVITSADGTVSCAFGDTWHGTGSSLVVDGSCTDGTARDIELDFDREAAAIASVSVKSVAGESAWMKPITWRFQECGLEACD